MAGIGFVGLGMMGRPMAQNLIKAGFDLSVYDVNPGAMQPCTEMGAAGAGTVAELAGCDIVFVIVHTGDQVVSVLSGADGLLRAVRPGHPMTVAVMSTVSPGLIRQIHGDLAESSVTLVDAPVSGGPIIAEMAGLSFMAGGDADAVERLKPYFRAMGNNIFHIGPVGSGASMKLVNNIVGLGNAYIFTEALKVGLEGGLSLERMVEVMQASSGRNWCTDNWEIYKGFVGIVLKDPNFHLTAKKDLETAIAWAGEMGQNTAVLENVLFAIANSDGVSEKLKAQMAG